MPEPTRVQRLAAEMLGYKGDPSELDVEVEFTLEKFDGEVEPGNPNNETPVEVIRGGDGKPTTIERPGKDPVVLPDDADNAEGGE